MEIILADSGMANFSVNVLDNDSEAEVYAAEELCCFLKLCSGADFLIKYGRSHDAGSIVLGIRFFGGVFSEQDYVNLGKDGFRIRTAEQNIYIVANTGRGVLYGAYDFLETVAGIRFLTAEKTYIPPCKKLCVPPLDKCEIPDFANRCFLNYDGMEEIRFMARSRTNNEYRIVPAKYGGKMGWFTGLQDEKFHPTHNILYYVNPEKYFEKHPDWFYIGSNGCVRELCYSSVGLLPDGSLDPVREESAVIAAAETLKRFILHSDDTYFMLGQMDISDCCQCIACKEQEKKYGRSGMNIRFVNAVARIINEWMKHENIVREVKLVTFAYAWSQEPPVGSETGNADASTVPEKNVLVRLAPISAENYFGLCESGQNVQVVRQVKGWANILRSCMTWTYHACFGSYFLYYPTMRHWKSDLRLFRKMGAEFVLMQGVYDEKNDWQGEIDHYVAVKMLWDSRQDPYRLREEFVRLYYGPAADEVLSFITAFDRLYQKIFAEDFMRNDPWKPRSNISQAWTRLAYPKLYTADFWQAQMDTLARAQKNIEEANVSADEKRLLLRAVDRIRLTPLFTFLVGYDKYVPNDSSGKEKFMNEFLALAQKLGVRHYREGNRSSLQNLKDIIQSKTQNSWGIFYEDR